MPQPIYHLDACVMLGPGDWTLEGQPVTRDALLKAMGHFGIHEALVRNSLCEIGDVDLGNRRLIEKTKEYPRLHPVWTVLPQATRELPHPEEMVAQMGVSGVAAAWLPYGAFGIPLETWCLGSLLEVLEAHRVPLFLCPTDRREGERADATDWNGVVGLCKAFPDLPMILTEGRIYKSQRALIATMETCPNLLVDISVPWLHRFVELLCERFGADRMVRGSQLPYRTPGATLMQLQCAEISHEDKALIAGGTLRKLCSWNDSIRFVAEEVTFPQPLDAFHRAAREMDDISGSSFYDCHGHIGMRNQRHLISDPPEELVREMDRQGVRVCCLFTWIGHGDMRYANDLTLDAIQKFPDRFVGFTALNPNHGEEEMRQELVRGLAHGMKGIKLINAIQGYPADGPLIDLACNFANEHGYLVLNHFWGPPEVVRGLCEKYTQAIFIAGHSEGNFVDLVREFPNLYICTCPFLAWGQTEDYVERYGSDRLLFGSDLQDLPIPWGLGPIFYARVPESDKRLILGDNLKRLLENQEV